MEAKCTHCGAVLGGAVELTSDPQLIYVEGQVDIVRDSVFAEETIISTIDLRCAEFYCTGSRDNGTLVLTYTNDDDKIYFRGVMAKKLFQELKGRCK